VTPLDARNVNVFTLPYAGATDRLLAGLLGPERVRLRTAAQSLRGTRPLAGRNERLDDNRSALRDAVADGVAHVRAALRRWLAAHDVGDSVADRRSILERGLDEWPAVGTRAVALANGTAARAVAREATRNLRRRARIAAGLRNATDAALADEAARPHQSTVRGVTEEVRSLARWTAGEATGSAVNESAGKLVRGVLGNVSAGLPVAPVPGYWYATINVWYVESRGRYERVTVRTRRGPRSTTYTRDGSIVALDVDGDGGRERLGRSVPVSFDVSTVVVVVVPPGPRGVGDTDGRAEEESPGWSSRGGPLKCRPGQREVCSTTWPRTRVA
jgi:hypothetical protein